MNTTILAIRAVTSEYAKRLLRPILWIGLAVYIFVMTIVIWISVAVSPWWLLLAFLPTILFCVGLSIWVGVRITASRVAPAMNKEQKTATKKVVDLLSDTAERLGTPRFILIFQVIKDVMSPPKNKRTLIGELTETPGQLHHSFEDLRKLF